MGCGSWQKLGAGGASGGVLCLAAIFFAVIFTDSPGCADDPFKSEIAWGVERERVTSQQVAEEQGKRNITTVGTVKRWRSAWAV